MGISISKEQQVRALCAKLGKNIIDNIWNVENYEIGPKDFEKKLRKYTNDYAKMIKNYKDCEEITSGLNSILVNSLIILFKKKDTNSKKAKR